MTELQIEKTAGHLRAAAERDVILSQQHDRGSVQWQRAYDAANKALLEHARAHNVARLNRCTGRFLKPHGYAFHFVRNEKTGKMEMRLSKQVGRNYFPLRTGPAVEQDSLHDEAQVSVAIWRAMDLIGLDP